MAPSFLLLYVITNEKTLKLRQVDRLPALPRFSPQKHVPTTLVGIPVVIYTLSLSTVTVTDGGADGGEREHRQRRGVGGKAAGAVERMWGGAADTGGAGGRVGVR